MASSSMTIESDIPQVERPSCSKPEDPNIANDPFFKRASFSFVGDKCLLDVDDQGNCCCCWAYAATEAITAAYARKNNGTIIPFSKQQLLDCMFKYYEMPPKVKKLDKKDCFTYSYNKAYKFAMHPGLVEESEYKFTEQRGECNCPPDMKHFKIADFEKVAEEDLKDGKKMKALIKEQPLTCAVPFVPSLQTHYGEDIYMGPTEEDKKIIAEKRKKKYSDTDPTEDDNNIKYTPSWHAMLIVGYGRENGVEYYLVKNSWGKEWGHRGFAKIKRSVVSRLSYPVLLECSK